MVGDVSELVRNAILAVALIIVGAKIGGELMGRIGQPPVLGELLIGVLFGNLNLFGITFLDPLRADTTLRVAAEVGAILLLFEVGVESDLVQLLAVGWSSLAVATYASRQGAQSWSIGFASIGHSPRLWASGRPVKSKARGWRRVDRPVGYHSF